MGNTSTVVEDEVSIRHDTEISMIVWLDVDINKKIENQEAQQQFRTIFDHFKAFENGHECEKYIRSISSKERVLLIVNDQQGKEIVARVHALRQVTSIYVHGKDKTGKDQWTKQFSKVKAVIKHLDELISRIKRDQDHFLLVDRIQPTKPSVIHSKPSQSTTEFLTQFAYSQLLSNVLLRSKPTKKDKTDLISLCEHIHQNSESDLKIIDQFQQTYTSHKALWWYTRLTCFDRMLNQALRTKDINTLFLFQFFIHDLHQQITEYQCQHPIRAYRSQLMIDDEINSLKESVGSFISIHTFFSTLVDRHRALRFLDTCDLSDGFHRVFFEIDADPTLVTSKPFADITRYSDFPQEREILFSIGSLFRITNVQQRNDQIWIIQMTFCGDDDSDLKPLFQEMERKYGSFDGEVAFISFSRLLRKMKKIDEAEKYCLRLLEHFSSDYTMLDILYNELMDIASSKNDCDLYDQWHQKSIEMKKKTQSLNYTDDFKSRIHLDHYGSGNNLRFLDVAAEKHEILLPIEGHEKMALVTLEEAIEPLIPILSDIRRKAHTAKLKCKNPSDGLTSDQSAAIMLYTMEWEPQDQCLYFVLNAHLRAPDRKILKPWFLYLKLIFTGLSRLPSIQRTIYRGVKLDLSSTHSEGKQFFWWGFSSCTTTMNVLKSDQFLGTSGIRTLFHIECTHGKDIRHHSYYEQEDEILLLPATYLEVMSSFEMAPNLHVIQVKEIPSEFPYLEPIV